MGYQNERFFTLINRCLKNRHSVCANFRKEKQRRSLSWRYRMPFFVLDASQVL